MSDKNKKITEHRKRVDRVFFVYHFYIYNWNKSDIMELAINNKTFNFEKSSLDIIEYLAKNFDEIREEIQTNLKKGWKFERLGLLERSVLLTSSSEIKISKTDNDIIINESVIMAKDYCDENAYKMINAILEKISK